MRLSRLADDARLAAALVQGQPLELHGLLEAHIAHLPGQLLLSGAQAHRQACTRIITHGPWPMDSGVSLALPTADGPCRAGSAG